MAAAASVASLALGLHWTWIAPSMMPAQPKAPDCSEAFLYSSQGGVVIENQLEATDHRHLGQLLTYAAGLEAAIIVWISPTVREEHRQALDWLNRHTSENIDFFGVSLELIRIDASEPAVQFRLVSFPNIWSKSHASKQKGSILDKGSASQQLYQTLLDELREKYKFTNAKAAQPQNWFSFRSGVSGTTYTTTFATGAVLRAELYIDVGDIIQNKAIFDWLLARKTELETKMEEPLSWERLDNRRASRISVGRPNSSIDTVAAQGDELRKWLVSRLLKLKSVFGPLLEEAGASGAMQVSEV